MSSEHNEPQQDKDDSIYAEPQDAEKSIKLDVQHPPQFNDETYEVEPKSYGENALEEMMEDEQPLEHEVSTKEVEHDASAKDVKHDVSAKDVKHDAKNKHVEEIKDASIKLSTVAPEDNHSVANNSNVVLEDEQDANEEDKQQDSADEKHDEAAESIRNNSAKKVTAKTQPLAETKKSDEPKVKPATNADFYKTVEAEHAKAKDAVDGGKKLVNIITCFNCQNHQYCTHHKVEKYDQQFRDLKQLIESANGSDVCVVRNYGCKNLQMGAFEIYYNGELIFSKLQTKHWPNHKWVVNKVGDLVKGVASAGDKK